MKPVHLGAKEPRSERLSSPKGTASRTEHIIFNICLATCATIYTVIMCTVRIYITDTLYGYEGQDLQDISTASV